MQLPKYLYHTRNERRAFVVLMLLIILCFAAPYLFPFFISDSKPDLSARIAQISAFEAQLEAADSAQAAYYQSFRKNYAPRKKKNYYAERDNPKNTEKTVKNIQLQAFDPNTATAETLENLGLKPYTVRAIENYRSKGGQFRTKSDLKKIYSLDAADYDRLAAYISLPDSIVRQPRDSSQWKPKPFVPREQVILDINTATSEELQQLPSIGAGWAARIVKYRHALGGFISIDQVAEIYNFPDSTFQKIRPLLRLQATSPRLEQININTTTFEELARHPYLSNGQARAIIRWREQQKDAKFRKVEFILSIPELDDSKQTAKKILPYLTI
jgi:competence protein ComEA